MEPTVDKEMKFFLPHAHNESEERQIYAGIREFLAKEFGARLADTKIFGLTYVHEGQQYRAEVGKPHSAAGETVDVILCDESISVYYICTRSHGVTRGHPLMVNAGDVETVVPFDD